MKLLIGAVIFLLLSQLALAAVVTDRGSGITRGSIEFTFEYKPNDRTVVREVRMNDVLSIIHGQTRSGLPIKHQYFLKSRQGESWSYDILGGEKYQKLQLGEPVPVDLDEDGTPELMMTWTEIELSKSTFVFSPPGDAPVLPPEEPEETVEEPEETEEETLIPPVTEPEEDLPDRVPPTVVEQKGMNLSVILILLALVILAGGIYALYRKGFFEEFDDEAKKEQARTELKKQVEEVKKRPKPEPKAESKPRKPMMVTRSPRRR